MPSGQLCLMMQQPVHQYAKGVDVGAGIGLRKAVLFRSGKALCPEGDGVGFLIRLDAGNAKVDQHSCAVRPDHDILGLNVPVNNRRLQSMQRL